MAAENAHVTRGQKRKGKEVALDPSGLEPTKPTIPVKPKEKAMPTKKKQVFISIYA
jgi:hypothetical protein